MGLVGKWGEEEREGKLLSEYIMCGNFFFLVKGKNLILRVVIGKINGLLWGGDDRGGRWIGQGLQASPMGRGEKLRSLKRCKGLMNLVPVARWHYLETARKKVSVRL